ncbi:MAG: HNH endonuclease [Flavobacteriaceae bacterium]
MARPQRNNVFPKWNPQKASISRFKSIDRKIAYKTFRNSSSGFIKRSDVRDYLLLKYSNECVLCNSEENLQIDHIVSVYEHFKLGLLHECNLEANLQVLCRKCNTSKLP